MSAGPQVPTAWSEADSPAEMDKIVGNLLKPSASDVGIMDSPMLEECLLSFYQVKGTPSVFLPGRPAWPRSNHLRQDRCRCKTWISHSGIFMSYCPVMLSHQSTCIFGRTSLTLNTQPFSRGGLTQDEGNGKQDPPNLVKELDWSPGSNRAAQGGNYDFPEVQESPETPMQKLLASSVDTEGDDVLRPEYTSLQ